MADKFQISNQSLGDLLPLDEEQTALGCIYAAPCDGSTTYYRLKRIDAGEKLGRQYVPDMMYAVSDRLDKQGKIVELNWTFPLINCVNDKLVIE